MLAHPVAPLLEVDLTGRRFADLIVLGCQQVVPGGYVWLCRRDGHRVPLYVSTRELRELARARTPPS